MYCIPEDGCLTDIIIYISCYNPNPNPNPNPYPNPNPNPKPQSELLFFLIIDYYIFGVFVCTDYKQEYGWPTVIMYICCTIEVLYRFMNMSVYKLWVRVLLIL